jgi:hypothetical protein
LLRGSSLKKYKKKFQEDFMKDSKSSNEVHRRDFITKSLACGAFVGMGCPGWLAMNFRGSVASPVQAEHRFQTVSDYTYEQVFNFAFKNWYIRYIKGLEAEIGKEKFLEILKKVGWTLYEESTKRNFRDLKKRDVESLIANFWAPMQKSRLWSHTLPIEIIKQSPSEGIVRMPGCLVAKVFRDNDAADIGYAAICYADFAVAKTFNPQIKLTRNTCLMKGDDCCLFEYTLDE